MSEGKEFKCVCDPSDALQVETSSGGRRAVVALLGRREGRAYFSVHLTDEQAREMAVELLRLIGESMAQVPNGDMLTQAYDLGFRFGREVERKSQETLAVLRGGK